MAITNGYTTLEEFVDWAKSSGLDQDNLDVLNLERAITAVSRGIDQYCHRHFWQTSVATPRLFPPPCGRTLKLGPFNDLAVLVSVKTDASGDGTFETTWTQGTDFELQPLNPAAAPEARPWTKIRATGARAWPYYTGTGRSARVEVTGTWGWAAVPPNVEQACLIRTHAVFKRRELPLGVMTGMGEFAVRISRHQDPDVAALLDPYRHTAVLVA